LFAKVEFMKSAHQLEDLPRHQFPEIAFSGRSNVGKSSLINMLLGRKKMARISKTPGRTRSINFFNIDDRFCLVDLPGYGYAKVPEQEKEKWAFLIENYLHQRSNLKGIIQIVDVRHPPSEDDIMMVDWLKAMDIKYIIAATKSDKLKNSQLKPQQKLIAEKLGVSKEKILLTSAKNRRGRKPLLTFIREILN